MAITLFDGWEIDADSYAYILGKPQWNKKKDGSMEKRIQHPRYYGSLAEALVGLSSILGREFVMSNNTGLQQAIVALKHINQRITNITEEIDLEELKSVFPGYKECSPEEDDESDDDI